MSILRYLSEGTTLNLVMVSNYSVELTLNKCVFLCEGWGCLSLLTCYLDIFESIYDQSRAIYQHIVFLTQETVSNE